MAQHHTSTGLPKVFKACEDVGVGIAIHLSGKEETLEEQGSGRHLDHLVLVTKRSRAVTS